MCESYRVVCLVERQWDVQNQEFAGTEKNGTLFEISTESENGKTAPAGIVLLDDGKFEAVPLEFIQICV